MMFSPNKKAPKRFIGELFGGPDRIDKAMAELPSGLGIIENYEMINEHSVKRLLKSSVFE